jgi:hypothetical protein
VPDRLRHADPNGTLAKSIGSPGCSEQGVEPLRKRLAFSLVKHAVEVPSMHLTGGYIVLNKD